MSTLAAPLRDYMTGWLQLRARQAFPIKLRNPRIYIFPTRYGFVFFLMLLTILFGSINHNNNMGFLITFLLGGMSVVSIFHTFHNLSGLTLVSARTGPVFAGQRVLFEILVKSGRHNRSSLSFYFLNNERTNVNLRTESLQSVKVTHKTEKRGLLKPNKLYVSTTYPLGLFTAWSTLLIDTSCLVYPKPVSGPLITTPGRKDDDHAGETGGPGVEDFAGLAAYQQGDPLQHIYWKAYSRGQGLHTKKFEGQLGKTIYFDPNVLPGHNLEMKLSRICHMILKADAIRLAYGLRMGSTYIEPGSGSAHKRNCLKKLALFGLGEK